MRKGLSSASIVFGLAIAGGTSFTPYGLAMAFKPGTCGFDLKTLSFRGTELEQAKCLLRPTKFAGHLGPKLATLPPPFEKAIGTPFRLETAQFRQYLVQSKIAPDSLGGSIDEPLSRSAAGNKPYARYFVIHDVSLNFCEDKSKLPKSDEADAPWNLVSRWRNNDQAHLYITRDGKLIAPQGRTFATPWYATKLEDQDPNRARGLFLHVENVQLRNVDAKPGQKVWKKNDEGELECINDRIAQKPGLTEIQYERLALVYIAASHRVGKWLVPAYHLAVDDGVGDAHDDPQNFDLNKFGEKVCGQLKALGRDECAAP